MESPAPPGRARAISLRELAFVRDVLIPRAWVQGAEVDELLRLRAKIDAIFSTLRQEPFTQPPAAPGSAAPPESALLERTKKPRHLKRRRGQPPPAPGAG